MSDILKTLRELSYVSPPRKAEDYSRMVSKDVLAKAADEIERLCKVEAMHSAAPDMAEALEKAANTLAMARERLEEAGFLNAARDCAEDELAARAALKKARGEE